MVSVVLGECLTSGRYPFKCLQFELPPDVEPEEVNVVELWFYKVNYLYLYPKTSKLPLPNLVSLNLS